MTPDRGIERSAKASGRVRAVCAFWSQPIPLLLLGGVILSACTRGDLDRTGALRFDLGLGEPEVFVSSESGLLGAPSGLAIDSSRQLWVSDFRGKRLLVIGLDGSNPRLLGREGGGPGELSGPLGVVAGRDFVRVADAFNNRLQDYGIDGVHRADHSGLSPMLGGAALASDGYFVVPRPLGDSALAEIYRLGSHHSIQLRMSELTPVVYRDVSDNSRARRERAAVTRLAIATL